MARPLLPPHYVTFPAEILYDKEIPDAVKVTWGQLAGLAWGKEETPPLSMGELMEITGRARSAVYGHLSILRRRGALLLRKSALGGTFICSFPDLAVQNSGLQPVQINGPPVQKSGINESRNLDSPYISPPVIKNIPVNRDVLREERVQKTGQQSRKLDSRTNHPAIQAYKHVTSRYPNKSLYDALITTLTDAPDEKAMMSCYQEWCKRGYNPQAATWALEWYPDKVPDSRKNGSKPAVKRNYRAMLPADDDEPEAVEPEPAPTDASRAWDAVLAQLRMPKAEYDRHIKPVRVVSISDDIVLLAAPTQDDANWLSSRLDAWLRRTWTNTLDRPMTVFYTTEAG